MSNQGAGGVGIALAGVSKSYDGQMAVEPLDLLVEARTTLALIGPSGCGKSTLLRMVLGLVRPDAGTVEISGTRLGPDTLAALRLRMGYVIQEGGLFPHLTTSENACIVARHLGWPAERVRARIETLRDLTRLDAPLLDRFPFELSGGQRQRVGLMRALFLDPEVLLLDEPLGALDPLVRVELQEDLKGIFQQLRKTVLLVTHDMAEAAFLGDRVALMKDGRILQMGPVRDLVGRPADPFVARFIRAQRPAWVTGPGSPS